MNVIQKDLAPDSCFAGSPHLPANASGSAAERLTSIGPAATLAPKVKLYKTGILILLLLLTIVMMDQSLCLSCTFELPDASSDGDADPGGDCSLCLTLAQPAEPDLFMVELEGSATRSSAAATVPDSFLPSVFHPPQSSAGP